MYALRTNDVSKEESVKHYDVSKKESVKQIEKRDDDTCVLEGYFWVFTGHHIFLFCPEFNTSQVIDH